jgi:hypothetical protein
MHLTFEELIDAAEDPRVEAAMPHVQSCDACRREIVALRATMAAAAGVDVPEPSPLFWDHLSHRVREAVESAEAPESRSAFAGWTPRNAWRAWAMAGVAAAVVVSLYVTAPRTLPSVFKTLTAGRNVAAVAQAPLEPFGSPDDPSLALFADLTEQIDPLAINDAGWSSHVGVADEMIAGLTDRERRELERLLSEELAKS